MSENPLDFWWPMIDPIAVLMALCSKFEVFYMDTDPVRLATARRIGVKTIDASLLLGRGMTHPEILLAVHTDNWHPVWKREYIHIGQSTFDVEG